MTGNKYKNQSTVSNARSTELEAIAEKWVNLILTHINYKKKDDSRILENNKYNER